MTIKWRRAPPQLCEYPDCQQSAVGYVEAQWTLADFVRYEMCGEHLVVAAEQLRQQTVEGERCWPAVHWYLE